MNEIARQRAKQVGTAPIALRAAISLDDKGKAPTEIRLFAAGDNETDRGYAIRFDEIAAAMVMEAYRVDGKERIYADWNHGMLPKPDGRQPTREEGMSSCSFIPVVRDGDLFATAIEWTDDGRADVESRKYNLFSPAINPWCDDEGVVRPRNLINFALVNLAGLRNIEPLLAAMANTNGEGTTMTEAEIAAMKARIVEIETENRALRGLQLELSSLSGVLVLSADAGASARVEAVRNLVAFRGDVLALTAVDSIAAAKGVIAGWKEKALGYDALATEKAQGEIIALTAQMETIITTASKEGKAGFTPASHDARRADVLKMSGGKAITKDGIEWLTAFAASMPKAVVTPGSGPTPPAGGAPPASPGTAKMDRLMGVEGEAYAKWHAAEVQAGRLPA